MQLRAAAALVLLGSMQHVGPTSAQGLEPQCDVSIQALRGATGYQRRVNDNRCEGFYESPVSATGLELVSATIGPIVFDPQADGHAVITVPVLPSSGTDAVDIQVVGLPLGLYYRLDAKAAPGSALRWPLADVVAQTGLKSSDVGAFGHIAGDQPVVVVPLAITSPDVAPGQSGIVLMLRSPVDLEGIWWRELRDDGATEYQELASRVYGGDIVRFEVPDGQPGTLRLEFTARLARSGQQRSLHLSLMRPS